MNLLQQWRCDISVIQKYIFKIESVCDNSHWRKQLYSFTTLNPVPQLEWFADVGTNLHSFIF
jgi:hypothetical protein